MRACTPPRFTYFLWWLNVAYAACRGLAAAATCCSTWRVRRSESTHSEAPAKCSGSPQQAAPAASTPLASIVIVAAHAQPHSDPSAVAAAAPAAAASKAALLVPSEGGDIISDTQRTQDQHHPGSACSSQAAAAGPMELQLPAAPAFPARTVLLRGAALLASLFALNGGVRLIPGVGLSFWLRVPFMNFMPGYAPGYILCFCLGVRAQGADALRRLPSHMGYISMGISLLLYPVLAVFVLGPLYLGFSPTAGGSVGVTYLVTYTLWEAAFGLTWAFGLLVIFRQHVNRKPGRLGAVIIGAAYTVYVIHPLVIVIWFRALIGVVGVSWLLMAFVASALAVPSCWVVGAAIKAVPGAGRVL